MVAVKVMIMVAGKVLGGGGGCDDKIITVVLTQHRPDPVFILYVGLPWPHSSTGR